MSSKSALVIEDIKLLLNEKLYCSHEKQLGISYSKILQRKIKQSGIKEAYLLICGFDEFNCLDAALFSMYHLLTNHAHMVRNKEIRIFPIAFKSISLGKKHAHIVLGICINNRYGAIGLSREKTLTSKSFYSNSLSGLVINFIKNYRILSHNVDKINIGQLVQMEHLHEPLNWKKFTVYMNEKATTQLDLISTKLVF